MASRVSRYRAGRSEKQRVRAEEAHRWLHREHGKKTHEALLKEYETLRAEVTTCMQTQASILAFGAAAIGFVFAAASQADGPETRGVLFLLLAPFLCYLILAIWLAELLRMLRAGAFLMHVEKRLDEEFEIGALTWESLMYYGRKVGGLRFIVADPDRVRALAITLLFLAIAGTSIALGWDSVSGWAWQRVWAIVGAVLFLGVIVHLSLLQGRQIYEILTPLAAGTKGRDVKQVQETLKTVGYYEGVLDGAFGEKTKEAVLRFQEDRHLKDDGVVGIITRRFLDAASEGDEPLATAVAGDVQEVDDGNGEARSKPPSTAWEEAGPMSAGKP